MSKKDLDFSIYYIHISDHATRTLSSLIKNHSNNFNGLEKMILFNKHDNLSHNIKNGFRFELL
jgi:hypothetical protein